MIESITREVEVGGLYLGKVTRIMGFGAFVEILPGKEGLVRIGELADYHVPTVEDVVSVGDEIMVVVDRDRPPGPRQPVAQGRDAASPGQGARLIDVCRSLGEWHQPGPTERPAPCAPAVSIHLAGALTLSRRFSSDPCRVAFAF